MLRCHRPQAAKGQPDIRKLQAKQRESNENRHRGSGHPLTPATPPDMRVRIGRFRGLRKAIEQPRKAERVEVGKRKRVCQSGTIRQSPGTVRTARRVCSEIPTDPELT